MRLDKLLPPKAMQIRYTHAIWEYENDNEDDDRYCVNEDECTNVYDLILETSRKAVKGGGVYYRRRHKSYAQNDVKLYQDWVNDMNQKKLYDSLINVKVHRIGRRVVIEYKPEHARKMLERYNLKNKTTVSRQHIYSMETAQEQARRHIEEMLLCTDEEGENCE
tara:strand:- start:12188 stop:12679 length:492 start_codon:yes stop_codon:yes gene_type:complete